MFKCGCLMTTYDHLYIYIYIYIYMYMYIYNIYGDIYVCFIFKTPHDFRIISGKFCYLPGEKFTARSHPGTFFKIWNIPR